MTSTYNGNPNKVRIGIGLGAWPFGPITPASVLDFIDRCEALDIDSLWLSDRIAGRDDIMEPVTFMAFMASRLRNMMFGTSVIVLPVRHPVVLAKELATLDLLSGGRLLPAVGIGPPTSDDFRATGIEQAGRGRRTDEAIRLMKRLWTEDSVTFEGEYYSIQDISVTPKPAQVGGPPIWIGGRSKAAYRRAGTLGDGWLSSSITVEETREGVEGHQGLRRRGQPGGPRGPFRHLPPLPLHQRPRPRPGYRQTLPPRQARRARLSNLRSRQPGRGAGSGAGIHRPGRYQVRHEARMPRQHVVRPAGDPRPRNHSANPDPLQRP